MVLQKVEDMRMAKVTSAENLKSLILSQIFMLFFPLNSFEKILFFLRESSHRFVVESTVSEI